MKSVFKALPDNIYLSEINIPGTHDSCTAFCSMSNMSRCQNMTVKEQLDAGIRLFDIRLGTKAGKFFLVHALATCYRDGEKQEILYLEEVLDAFRAFLRENPEETLVVSIKQDRGIMNRWFFPALYDKYIKGNESEWYLKNENPTLAECRGRMVLMRRCKVWRSFLRDSAAGLDFSHWKDQDGKRKTKHENVILQGGIKDPELIALVQDRYGLAPDVKWSRCALPFFENAAPNKAVFYVSFLSTAYREKGETLFETAEKVNAEFMKYELKRDVSSGWMLFDFPSEKLVDKIIASNLEIYKEKIK